MTNDGRYPAASVRPGSRAGVLLGSPRIEDVLPGILTVARESVAADGYAVWRLDRARGAWVIVGHQGVSEEFAAAVISSHHGQPAGRRAGPRSDRRRRRADGCRCSRPGARLTCEEGIVSMLAIPLVIDGEAAGTLVFYYRRRHGFRRGRDRNGPRRRAPGRRRAADGRSPLAAGASASSGRCFSPAPPRRLRRRSTTTER